MRKDIDLKQWQSLYEVAIRLKEMKPWTQLWDMDLIRIILPGYEEPYFCSIMGNAGECLAVGVYKGYDSIHGFYDLAYKNKMPPSQLIRYQKSLMCYFGDREELTDKERKIIKDLGLKFRGRNEWIYFRSFEPRYAPYQPDESQVIELTEVLRNLYMALIQLFQGKIKVDFDNGYALQRSYDEETNLWLNYAVPNELPPRKRIIPAINDHLLIAKLKKMKSNGSEVELDTLYFDTIIKDRQYHKPIIPVMLLLADSRTGTILGHDMLSPEDDIINKVFNVFIGYIQNFGKPKMIHVRDEYMKDNLKDLCKRIGVSIKIDEQLRATDFFASQMARYDL